VSYWEVEQRTDGADTRYGRGNAGAEVASKTILIAPRYIKKQRCRNWHTFTYVDR
jgi:hypothetical protein